VLLARLGLRQSAYPDPAARLALYQRLLPRLAQAPGVESVALSEWPALQITRPRPIETQGAARALGVPVVEGRAFQPSGSRRRRTRGSSQPWHRLHRIE
jgi:hypothetical protein